MKETEIWKPVPGYEGMYEISNYGRVKSHLYSRRFKNNERILIPGKQKTGYLTVCLYKDKKKRTLAIHRLVAENFIPNPNNLPIINHKDENKKNNYYSNLEWCTYGYNLKYGSRPGKYSKPILQFDKKGNFINEFPSLQEAARQVNGNQSNISHCCNGRSKTAYGFIWKFK